MAVSGMGPLCDGTQARIFCFPAVRSCQQSQGLRDLSLLPPTNGHSGNTAALHGIRDARSGASRLGTAICGPSSSHSIAALPHLATKSTVPMSTARCKHSCSATPEDAANSSAEAFCQPSPGDMERQNLRAASQNVGDAAQCRQEESSQTGLSGAQHPEEPSHKTSAQPGRAHFKPGEVLKHSSRRSVRRRSAKEVVIDVTGEAVPDSSSRREGTSPVLRSSDISPGDPMEEGWVADTHNDARAQHWMSESWSSQPLAWSGSRFLKGSSGAALAGSPDGDPSRDGRVKQTSGGGGKGGGGGRGRGQSTAEGDNHGDAAANATVIVYTFLVAVLVFFWINIYIVVSKPEKIGTIGKKIAKFMSSATWRVQQLQRQKSVAAAAPLKTRYRTLTVYRSGYSRLARRLISPGPAVDVETAEGSHIDRDSAYTSMFLEVPRPQVFAHPVSLRRRSTSRSSQRRPTLESSPSLMSMPSARHAPSMLAQMKSSTPFNDEGSSGLLIPLPSLRRASGTLGSVFIDESGGSGDHEELLLTPRLESVSKQSDFKTEFNSCTLDTQWPAAAPMFQRHATWTGCMDLGSVGTWTVPEHRAGRTVTGCLEASELDETQMGSDEYRDLQKNFVGNLLPGSLTRVSLQRHSASARQDIVSHTPTPPVTRTKSQPIESEEQQHTKQATIRKSASLHSVRDALVKKTSSTGDFLGAHRLTGDLAEHSESCFV